MFLSEIRKILESEFPNEADSQKSNTSAISRGMISTGQLGLRQAHPSSAALILPDILRLIVKSQIHLQ